MFLFVLVFVANVLNSSNEPAAAAASSGITTIVLHAAEDALCNAALDLFERGTDAVISRYIRPHLTTMIHDAATSPDNKADSPPHVDTIKRIVSGDLSVDAAPRDQLKEMVLSAVQKTLEEKEKQLEDSANQISGMFTPKTTLGISTISGVILAAIGTLAGIFGTKSSC